MYNITKKTQTILFASLIAAILIPTVLAQSAEASHNCPYTGANGIYRCYATQTYVLDDDPLSVNVDITPDDISVTSGFLQNSLWSHLSDGRFIETGFQDQSNNNEKILCGVNGGISNFQTIDFTDSHSFNAYSLELSNGAVWKTGIKFFDDASPHPEESCTSTSPSGTYMEKFIIGSEASKPNNSNYEHDWDDLEIDYSDVVAGDFSSQQTIEDGTGYDVEKCGSGNGQYRHIQTGKGNLSSC